MFSSKRPRSFIVRAAVVAAMPLMLAACSADLGPGPMPTGYAHQNEYYKAQPGPRPVLMKKHMMENQCKEVREYHPNGRGSACGDLAVSTDGAAMSAISSAAWDSAADDLISRMVNELGKPMENVYVVPGSEPGLEMALSSAMLARTIPVSAAPGNGPFDLQYDVQPITGSSMVNVTLKSVGSPVHSVSGVYDIGSVPAMSAMPAASVEPTVETTTTSDGVPMPIMPMPADESVPTN